MALSSEEKAEIEGVIKALAGSLQGLFQRVEKLERLIYLKATRPRQAIPGSKKSAAALEDDNALLEAVAIERIFDDIGDRLGNLERFAAAASGRLSDIAAVLGGATGDAGEDPVGDDEGAGADTETGSELPSG